MRLRMASASSVLTTEFTTTMKRKYFLMMCLLVSPLALANGAEIVTNNLSSLHPITKVNGDLVPLGTGFVKTGTIALSDTEVMNSPGDRAGLIASFTEFGTTITFGAGGSGGFFSGTISAPINPGNPLIAQNIYIVAGDGSDLGNSDAVWIFKSDSVFDVDPADQKTIALAGALADGSILVGTPTNVFVPLAGNSFDGSQMVLFVPEPGVGILLASAGLMLFTRRRRH